VLKRCKGEGESLKNWKLIIEGFEFLQGLKNVINQCQILFLLIALLCETLCLLGASLCHSYYTELLKGAQSNTKKRKVSLRPFFIRLTGHGLAAKK